MNIPKDLYYSDDDEWVQVEDDGATVGITDYAQDQLNDIVYLELPSEGDAFEKGEAFGVVESVKAASDLIMPVGGTVTAVNEALIDAPETINADPYSGGWMIKITLTDSSELTKLMDADAYQKFIEERE